MRTIKDNFGRVHDYLRISLTDKCNLNCLYCNPSHIHSKKLKRNEILTFDELLRLIRIFTGELGVKKIRFTGGEPLARKNIMEFFRMLQPLKEKYGFETGLTTNGTLLEDKLADLKEAGLDRLNISIDSLKPDRFTFITGKDKFDSVIRSIRKASELGFEPLKINVVVMKNLNDDELIDFVDFVKNTLINVRFIEFMPFGSNQWQYDGFLSSEEVRNIIESKYPLVSLPNGAHSVSNDYGIAGYSGKVSFISSISRPFCSSCNRLRIDAKGKMRLCLFSDGTNELNLKELLNIPGYSDSDICEFIENTLLLKRKAHPEIDELINVNNDMWSIGG